MPLAALLARIHSNPVASVRILALETTTWRGGVAALEDGKLLQALELNPSQRSAQSLAPAIAGLLSQVGWTPPQIGLIAVAVGPGSFTGLRIGVTTAKTFAYAVGAEVVGVNTLEVIALQAPPEVGSLTVLMDAQRQELFTATFHRDNAGQLQWHAGPEIISSDQFLAGLKSDTVLSGPMLDRLADKLPPGVNVLPAEFRHPTAASVGQLAASKYAAGQRDDLWQLAPLYLRRSAAEEKLDASESPRPAS